MAERRPPLTDPLEIEALRGRISEKRSRLWFASGPKFETTQSTMEEQAALGEEVRALDLQLEDSLALLDRRRHEREEKQLEVNLGQLKVNRRIASAGLLAAACTAVAAIAAAWTASADWRRERERRRADLSFLVSRTDVPLQAAAGAASGVAGVRVSRNAPPTAGPSPGRGAARAAQPPVAPAAPVRRYIVLHILARNLSERPGAIVDFTLVDGAGVEVPFDRREYLERLDVPITIAGWGARRIDVRLDSPELEKATHVVFIDTDGKRIRIPVTGAPGWIGGERR